MAEYDEPNFRIVDLQVHVTGVKEVI